jgi:hypothetical protein
MKKRFAVWGLVVAVAGGCHRNGGIDTGQADTRTTASDAN